MAQDAHKAIEAPWKLPLPACGERVGVRGVVSMDTSTDGDERGVFEARYLAFLETITHLRPRLHRYCTRMTGSVLDGEDVVQDALFQAYRRLETFDDTRPLGPWLFRIAHNRCIDYLRRREVQQHAEMSVAATSGGVSESVAPVDPPGPALGRAVERLVLTLPPMERACVLLKDVFDYSLTEIAELVDSTVGGVKAALSRGRSKLAASAEAAPQPRRPSMEAAQVLHLYVERFNRRDWDGLRELIAADARLLVADRFTGRVVDSPYFGNYERWRIPWRLAMGDIDGATTIILLRRNDANDWVPSAPIGLELEHGRVVRITDYLHCPWVLDAATTIHVETANAEQ
jgi:RNA polymerase sigma-70 factor, ECF subfamily